MSPHQIFLYILTSVIWGTTWWVIKYQLSSTGIFAGVFYRFALASLILIIYNYFKKNNWIYSKQYHLLFFLFGIFNFSINYLLTYWCELYINSALAAFTFTTLVYYNMLGLFVFYKKKIKVQTILGSVIGILGVLFLFKEDIFKTSLQATALYGVLLGLIATFCASLGNMVSIKCHQALIPVSITNAWAMLYGAGFSLLAGLVFGDNFHVNFSFSFFWSLFYLTLFGTVIAFYAYQTLIKEIGAHKAAFTSIISPLIAVIISIIFENLRITSSLLLGMSLAILGNYLVLRSPKIKIINQPQV